MVSELLKEINPDKPFYLMNKNRPIYKFRFINDNSIQVLDVFEKPPFWIKSLEDWLRSRNAAKHRRDIKELLDMNGINTLKSFVLFTQCLSLTDTLWVKREDSSADWSSVNLYVNRFEDSLGVTVSDEFESTIPTLSTDGSFEKCWKSTEHGNVLVKRGRTDLEPVAEWFASNLKCCYASVIDYTFRLGSVYTESICDCFVSESVSHLPYIAVSDELELDEVSSYYEKLDCVQKFNDMLLHDAVTLNVDRHARNFGVLINSDTYEVLDMSPLYDFNMCYGFDRLYTLRMSIEELSESRPRRFDSFMGALRDRVNWDTYEMLRVSLQDLDCIPGIAEDKFQRMVDITKYQLDRIYKEVK